MLFASDVLRAVGVACALIAAASDARTPARAVVVVDAGMDAFVRRREDGAFEFGSPSNGFADAEVRIEPERFYVCIHGGDPHVGTALLGALVRLVCGRVAGGAITREL